MAQCGTFILIKICTCPYLITRLYCSGRIGKETKFSTLLRTSLTTLLLCQGRGMVSLRPHKSYLLSSLKRYKDICRTCTYHIRFLTILPGIVSTTDICFPSGNEIAVMLYDIPNMAGISSWNVWFYERNHALITLKMKIFCLGRNEIRTCLRVQIKILWFRSFRILNV